MNDIYDIVKTEIFDNINLDATVTVANASSGGSQVIELCKNKWVRVGMDLVDKNSKVWTITSIDVNGVITVTVPNATPDLVKKDVLTLKAVKWLFGTRKSANNEYALKGLDNRTKLPLVWLVDNIRAEEYGQQSSLLSDNSVKFFFLDDNNPEQYLNEDYRRNSVAPMIGLKDEVIRVIEDNKRFKELTSWNVRNITRFGTEQESGVFENILDDNLSGVELTVTLSIYKLNCNC